MSNKLEYRIVSVVVFSHLQPKVDELLQSGFEIHSKVHIFQTIATFPQTVYEQVLVKEAESSFFDIAKAHAKQIAAVLAFFLIFLIQTHFLKFEKVVLFAISCAIVFSINKREKL